MGVYGDLDWGVNGMEGLFVRLMIVLVRRRVCDGPSPRNGLRREGSALCCELEQLLVSVGWIGSCVGRYV
jgi:hypothetical protein